ncbi:uncharacterized protein LAESUDRAFT_641096 [Laetiporus sulphureus 93-53]|uniref:Transmembrane protein n=1 Tax=Laetiporus sulphureus 93-53 TaxID=1314785 RepID=A0A165HQV0_9APHY|nr:uncharacterized protein LAESUDRAFT_641096 [Laetiporus sulphureus 93-53]KZT12062.1 hypothetical protein LAESUDRAFT_641096 [Laetiporus sulphureus 93-53]
MSKVEPDDPRPPWLFRFSRTANWMLIPTVIVYSVFFGDFGEQEHVFSPPRRWLERQKAAFFSLSDAERKIAGVGEAPREESTQVRQDR